MIQIFINNQEAVPSLTSTIKLTRQNQFLKEVEGFTYDITFPMCHAANRRILGNLQRMDVRKTGVSFDSVRLVADNVEIISGTGIVTSVTQDEVKLQIKTGTATTGSRRYPDVFYEHFTTEISGEYGLLSFGGLLSKDFDGTQQMYPFYLRELGLSGTLSDWFPDLPSLTKYGVFGTIGQCIYPVVYSSTGDCFYNTPGMYRSTSGYPQYTIDLSSVMMCNPLPCWNLLYIVRTAIEQLTGYTPSGDIFTDSFATNLYFTRPYDPAGNTAFPKPSDQLPRWSVATLLEHLRNLFNLQYTIDPTAKTIVFCGASTSASDTGDVQAFEPLDEFSTDYDEDGLAYLSATNVAYDLENDNDSRYFYVLTDDLRASFPIQEYASAAAIKTAAAAMTADTRRRTIFHAPKGYYFYHVDIDDSGVETNEQLRRCAIFTPIIRDEDSDTKTELSFVPAGWSEQDVPQYHYFTRPGGSWTVACLYRRMGVATLGDSFTEPSTAATVQNVIEGEADATTSLEESTDSVSLFLLGQASATTSLTSKKWTDSGNYAWYRSQLEKMCDLSHFYMTGYAYVDGPLLTEGTYAAPPFSAAVLSEMGKDSLALTSTPATNYIGRYHEAIAGQAGSETLALVDTHTKVCIKFRADTIPVATKPFVFNGKKYICEKIEVEIKDGAVQPVKTGYFYEVTPGT